MCVRPLSLGVFSKWAKFIAWTPGILANEPVAAVPLGRV